MEDIRPIARILVLLLVGLLAFMTVQLWPQSKAVPFSDEFLAKRHVAKDAIDRTFLAEGFAYPLALLEAERDIDAMSRAAITDGNPIEGNVVMIAIHRLAAVEGCQRGDAVSCSKMGQYRF